MNQSVVGTYLIGISTTTGPNLELMAVSTRYHGMAVSTRYHGGEYEISWCFTWGTYLVSISQAAIR